MIEARKHIFLLVMAAVSSLCLSFLVFILFLQTPAISLTRLALASLCFFVALVVFYWGLKITFENYQLGRSSFGFRVVLYWILVSITLLLHFGSDVSYPDYPPFQRKSNVIISFYLDDSSNNAIDLEDVRIDIGSKSFLRNFSVSNDWEEGRNGFFLLPGRHGIVTWNGNVGGLNRVVISSKNVAGSVVVNWDGEEQTARLGDSIVVFKKSFAPPVWFTFVSVFAQLTCIAIFLTIASGLLIRFGSSNKSEPYFLGFVIICLSLVTVISQFESDEIKGRFQIVVMERHQAVLSGTSFNPWQYRILAEWLVEGLARSFGMLKIPDYYLLAFFLLRVIQNILIYYLFHEYLKIMGISLLSRFLGIVFLTGVLLNVFYHSDLSLNTYFDLIFYLLTCLLVASNSYKLIPLVILLASLNRETSGLIPVIVLLAWISSYGWKKMESIACIVLVILAWVVPFFVVRLVYRDLDFFRPLGYSPGSTGLFLYNMNVTSLTNLIHTLGFAPVLSYFSYRLWPNSLKRHFFVIVPAWFIIHVFGSLIAETRLFLVPQVIVFLPGLLFFLEHFWMHVQTNQAEKTFL